MNEQELEKIKSLADKLISTLDPTESPQEADKIVREVALSMYRDILKIKGNIEIKYVGNVCRYNRENYAGGLKGLKCDFSFDCKFNKEVSDE